MLTQELADFINQFNIKLNIGKEHLGTWKSINSQIHHILILFRQMVYPIINQKVDRLEEVKKIMESMCT